MIGDPQIFQHLSRLHGQVTEKAIWVSHVLHPVFVKPNMLYFYYLPCRTTIHLCGVDNFLYSVSCGCP